ncbi:MAG: thioredoxin-like domain-containing protein [Planctomycetota bacterium]|nr:thioredoxin-like domain-containing protein [Planctomycetota bacterium]
MLAYILFIFLYASLLVSQDPNSVEPVPENHAWDVLVTKLDVEERSWLLMWQGSDEGQVLIRQYLADYPDSPHREQAFYLRAVGYWSMFEYEVAAGAYAEYLSSYPDQQRSSLAMTRHVQSLIRSDQPAKAIIVAESYKSKPAAEQRQLAVIDALLLQGNVSEAKGQLQTLIDMAENNPRAGRMIEMLEAKKQQLELIGKPLASFSVKAWNTGKQIDPGTFRGHVLLLEFWATWCRPCMAQMPHLVQLYQRLHDRGFDILGIDLDQDVSRLKAVTESMGITWPQFNDGRKWDNAMAVSFDVRRIPFTILVDRIGIVRYVGAPAASLDRLVEELLGEGSSKKILDESSQPGPIR